MRETSVAKAGAGKNRDLKRRGGFTLFGASQLARKAEMLDSFERAGLGWFWATDAKGRLSYLSESAYDQLGWDKASVLGTSIADLFLPDESAVGSDEGRVERPLSFLLGTRAEISNLIVHLAKTPDEAIWWEIVGQPQFNGKGQFVGYRGSAKDASESRANSLEALRLAQFDPVTGLSNRVRIYEKLTTSLVGFRAAKRSCSVMLLGLDRFRQINETLGRAAGDELLKQVGARLKTVIGNAAEVARQGDDEFLIMLPDVDDRGELGELAERILQLVTQPYSAHGARAIIGASVGIATAPYDGVDADELIKAADLTLSVARGSAANYRFYSSELRDIAKRRQVIEEELHDAIANGELVMHYQPIVDAQTHKVKCFEALMRWPHPDRGDISPGLFIPIAEETGLILELGSWALERVCTQALAWPGDIRVAVNVSAIQFLDEDFVELVENALRKTGIAPSRLELEITESIFMGDQVKTQEIFSRLKALGVRLALDDFGTGYSSLSYLRHAPFDKIKIDQSFVRGSSTRDKHNAAIISAVVSLASALGMETVAEGVETKEELELVTSHGAGHLQGRLFSFAVSQEELLEKFESGDLTYEPKGPTRSRADRRTEYRRVGLVHGNHRYSVVLRNLSKSGALIEGLLDVPTGTEVVLDLGGGQLAVATVRRTSGSRQGVEFEYELISDGADGLCTRHRVSPYLIEAAGRPLASLPDDPYAALKGGDGTSAMYIEPKAFTEVSIKGRRANAA